MKFLENLPALLHKDALILGDTHFGLEKKLAERGIFDRSFSLRIEEQIRNLAIEHEVSKIIFLGDVKENLLGLDRTTYSILDRLSKIAQITVVKGNHDGSIENFPNAKIIAPPGFVYHELGLFHGHSWPDASLMQSKYLVCGHQHPMIELTDQLGKKHSEPAWFVLDGIFKNISEKYAYPNPKIKLILMPSFNPILGNVLRPNSVRQLGPLLNNKLFKLDSALVFRLNGTCLGKLNKITIE
ncbi:metallophosphoesterase family protein [Candidatus Micrarchaeota archaeon]|nr:metallophosphoesterase family protein [Candidatus Micrarchaeota archaeon]